MFNLRSWRRGPVPRPRKVTKRRHLIGRTMFKGEPKTWAVRTTRNLKSKFGVLIASELVLSAGVPVV
jgi:hypothetical protein